MHKLIKVIFLSNSRWGKKYEKKEFTRGFVFNYLFPRGLVLFANDKNSRWLIEQESRETQVNLLAEEKALKIYQKLHNFTLNFILKKDEKNVPFGSIGSKEILQELAKNDLQVEKNQLLNFHHLNKLGENIVSVRLSSNLIANLKIIIK